MKLTKLVLQNFRGFKEYIEIPISNLSVFIGRNDIGKSTILEALDILLGGNTIKFDKEDVCKFKENSEECIIGGVFSSVPPELIIDETATTSLSEELLLFKDDSLFLLYKTKSTSTLKPFIRTNFPTNKHYKGILDKKLDELQKITEEIGIDKENIPYNASVKGSIRKAIRNHISMTNKKGLVLSEQDVSIDKEDGKSIFDKLLKYLPIYSLFQSDRKNEDQDKEAQDPLKTATKEILGTLGPELSKIEIDVKNYVKKLADITLKKLEEMNPELADIIEPEFSKTPDWSTVFKYSLKTKDDIPLNKRGSGVRRMILLNFFRAKAEKILEEETEKQNRFSNNIIYAFEEPETSQHPNHQKLLIESFIELAQNNSIQIILTTHSPGIAKLLPKESVMLLKKSNSQIQICYGSDEILKDVSTILGIMPDIDPEIIKNIKLVICVEGHTDVDFIKNINQAIPELNSLVDIGRKDIVIIPLGGSSLQFWVNHKYLKNLDAAQVHIYDSDIGSTSSNNYTEYIDAINNSWDKSIAFATQKRELENYIHPNLINLKFGSSFSVDSNWDTMDIPTELKSSGVRMRQGKIKDCLCMELSKNMSKDKLMELGAWDEINLWFQKMKELLEL